MERREHLPKRPGTATSYGTEYEFLLAGLINVRAWQEEGLQFEIASNVEGAGAFDDVVVRFFWEEGGEKRCITYFIQLKHAEKKKKVRIGALTAPKGDFSIRKYFEDYKILRETCIDKEAEVKGVNCSHFFENEFRFVIFTNREIARSRPGKTHSQNPKTMHPNPLLSTDDRTKVPLHSRPHPFSQLFTSTEDTASSFTSDDRDVWNLLEHDETASEEDKRMYREEFLPRVLIFRCQENVDGLKCLIRKELNKYFELGSEESGERLFNNYLSQLKRWYGEKDGSNIMSEKTRELQDSMRENLNQMFREQLNQSVDISLRKRLNFAHERWTGLVNAIKENKTVTSEIPNLKTFERCLKLLQIFKSDFRDHNNLLLREGALLQYQSAVKRITRTLDSNGIVLLSMESAFALPETLNDLCSDCECKFVFACARPKEILRNEDFNSNKNATVFTDKWCLNQLTQDSQEDILNCIVNFQGRKMQLKDLESAWPSVREDVDAEMLLALLAGNATLGAPLPQLEDPNHEKDDCYIPRSLEHRPALQKAVLYLDSKADHLVLSMFPKEVLEEVESKCGKCHEGHIQIENKDKNCTLHFWPSKERRNLENDNRKFEEICSRFPTHNIHHLVYEKGLIIWTASQGDTSNITPYLACPGLDCRPIPLCSHTDLSNCQSRMMFLTGEPGIGKSTFVSHLGKREKYIRWIITVPLISHTRIFHEMPKRQEIHCGHMLYLLAEAVHADTSSSFRTTMSFLEKCLTETGCISVYIDGVDEISPAHKEKALQILKLLQESRASKVWVTSRMHLDDDLREIFRVEPFRLQPFMQREQIDYVCRVVRSEIGRDMTDDEKETIINILEELSKSTAREGRAICDIPLHANILAEILIEETDRGHENNFTILKLYQAFVAKKCKIYCKKCGIDSTSSSLQSFESQYSLMHQECAMMTVAEIQGIIEQKILEYCLQNHMSLLKDENTGILGIKDNIPHFIHYTFAEYYAALWLKENYLGVEKLENVWARLSPTLRAFFDAMLADGHHVHEAAINGDPQRLKRQMALRGQGACLERDEGGRSALHLAAINGNTEACRLLLEIGPGDEKDNVLGWTPLRYADSAQHLGTVDAFLGTYMAPVEEIIDSLKSNAKDGAILRTASENGHFFLAKALLINGAEVNRANEDGWSALQFAAFDGHESVAELLLESGASVNARANGGFTPLHDASQEGHIQVVQVLVPYGAEINAANEQGATALHLAAIHGHLSVVEMLLSKGANPKAVNIDGWTPLHAAASSGHGEVVKMLLESGASVNACEKGGFTPLHDASQEGHIQVVEVLVSYGAEINAANDEGTTALHLAAHFGRLAVAQVLLDKGANVESADKVGCLAIHVAALGGHGDVMLLLLQNGVSVNAPSKGGNTPLHCASQEGHRGVVEVLLSNGASLDARTADGETALYFAAQWGHLEVVALLLAEGADASIATNEGTTPLEVASAMGNEGVAAPLKGGHAASDEETDGGVSELHVRAAEGDVERMTQALDATEDVDARTNGGVTPLYVAAHFGRVDVLRALLKRGADAHAQRRSDARTPLHAAAAKGQSEAAEVLLSAGEDLVDARDAHGCTPLFLAAQNGHGATVQTLLRRGANPNIRADDGRTAGDAARQAGHDDVVRLLQSSNTDTLNDTSTESPL